jgi:acyl carrier protein
VRTVVGRIVAAASEVDAAAVLSHIKGWDSLAALRVLVALEKEFGVVLPHNLFSESPTLANVAPLILGGLARRSEVQ